MGTARIQQAAILASQPVRWTLRQGTDPHTETFDVMPKDRQQLLAPGVPTILTHGDGGRQVTIQGLFVLHAEPGENPHIQRVRVADRRVWWDRVHILRRLNWRRVVGPKRLTDPKRPPEIDPVVDRFQYAPWSVKVDPNRPWTSLDVLEDVLTELLAADGAPGGYRIEDDVRASLASFPLEKLYLDDPGNVALRRALEALPRVAVRVDPDSTVVVYSRASGREAEAINALGPPVVGEGIAEFVSFANLRPSAVHILYTREHELRFDYEESASFRATVARKKDGRFAENVLPVPDFTLKLASGETVVQGTWITIEQALGAWALPENGPLPLGRALDFQDLRRAFVPFMDILAGLNLLGLRSPDADWASRIQTLQQHYRKTFRISRRWIDRLLSLEAYRVALLDPTTGQRAPAAAWADFAYLGSQRSLFKQATDGEPLNYANNVKAYPLDGKIGPTVKPAPATVTVVDSDQGIIRLDFLTDTTRMFDMILPSMVELEGSGRDGQGRPLEPGPVGDMRRGLHISFNVLSRAHADRVPQLTADHKVAFIVTGIPASPNTEAQLHRVIRKPTDIVNLLPSGLRTRVTDSRGPIMEVRVGAGVETARVAWLDEKAAEIEKAFGIGNLDSPPAIEDLIVNAGVQRSVGTAGASLEAISDAVAARVYASLADRWLGEKAGAMNQAVVPLGWIDTITHELGPEGEALTRIDLPSELPSLSLYGLMDANTRAILMKLAQPGKGS